MIYHMKILLDQRLNPLYEAAIEATEEAILNSLCMAREMEGANHNFAPALPIDEVKDLLSRMKPREPRKPPEAVASRPPPKAVQTPPEPPTPAVAPPSAVRGAEGMMTVPLPKPGDPSDAGT